MKADEFLEIVNTMSVGKKLPEAIYIHESALICVSKELSELITKVSSALLLKESWNVLKLYRKEFKITFLHYPDFLENAYPSLELSTLVDLKKLTTKTTSYKESTNPPILHRKELMIDPSSPYFNEFAEITAEGEQAGLYEDTHLIGFKEFWLRLIERRGFSLVDGRLMRSSMLPSSWEEDRTSIDRHKTAIVRYDLSAPMQALDKHRFLDGDYTVFDYGCGRGDDLAQLETRGINASGWDPNHRPDADLISSDIVNLGFVINVIEDLEERVEALTKAYKLAESILVVSAMLGSEATTSKFKPFKDGVITSRNTFQKYYSQDELKSFIEHYLPENAIAAGAGIFFIFKDKNLEESFLASRYKRKRSINRVPKNTVRISGAERKYLATKEILDQLREKIIELGRLPFKDEIDFHDELIKEVGNIKKAFNILTTVFGEEEFKQAEKESRSDLLVFLALNMLRNKTNIRELSEKIKRELRVFFGTPTSAANIAKLLLQSISDMALIENECTHVSKHLAACRYNESHSLIIHRDYLTELPDVLRVYVGCAAELVGDLDTFQLVKIHFSSSKVSFMTYENFDSSPLPKLLERVKVELSRSKVKYFDYLNPNRQPVLYWKSQYIDDSFNDFQKQKTFDSTLAEMKLIDEKSEFGPYPSELNELLRVRYGKKINGYRFYKIT